ncbi:ParB/RepB/Spo0J family partition protein [Bacteriovorax stolpii]|uniref:ParB/RepB/Spo0J family partition protein n=1 Tax=Bacteriovorax stolpii TaxID=960 RepID=UPI00163CE63B|nr:ParB/RepB/Spo0J family partition protein [Bacteriovorax stolpii]
MDKITNGTLQEIPIDKIIRNPENPRTIFRQNELDSLIESIRQFGVQVPISVFKKGKNYVIVDGERRWRCSLKLNKKTIPAIIQEEPSPLNNLLLMFNIHALREQWDLFTIAKKLPEVINLLKEEYDKTPTEREIAAKTGLLISQIRRCKVLIDLPDHYKDMLLDELHKPKSKQRLSEDMFLEMEKAITRVEKNIPDAVSSDKNFVRDILIKKYQNEVIDNVVDFRLISKIVGGLKIEDGREELTRKTLKKLFNDNNYSIRSAYQDSVSDLYLEKDFLSRIHSLINRFDSFEPSDLDTDTKLALESLITKATKLLEDE